MGKLVASDWLRMRRSLIFRVCVLAMAAAGILIPVGLYLDKRACGQLDGACAENVAFAYDLFAGLLCAAFCSVFQSEEYSERTVCNKLMVGHARASVYLSQTFVSFLAGVIMCLAYVIPSLLISLCCMGSFDELTPGEVIGYYLTGMLHIAVCTALFSMITVCIPKKAGSAAICFLTALIIIYLSLSVHQLLEMPEFTFRIIDGVPVEHAPNPRYPDEAKRALLERIFAILPAGQAYQLCYRYVTHMPDMIVWDIGLTGALLGAGVVLFGKKDMK